VLRQRADRAFTHESLSVSIGNTTFGSDRASVRSYAKCVARNVDVGSRVSMMRKLVSSLWWNAT
jgi:hypothetical protein